MHQPGLKGYEDASVPLHIRAREVHHHTRHVRDRGCLPWETARQQHTNIRCRTADIAHQHWALLLLRELVLHQEGGAAHRVRRAAGEGADGEESIMSRPFGVALLIAGYDEEGPQLYDHTFTVSLMIAIR